MTKQELCNIGSEMQKWEKMNLTMIFKDLYQKTLCLYVGYFGIYVASWQEDGKWFFGIATEDKKREKVWKYGDEDGFPFPVEDMVEHLIYPEYAEWDFEGLPRDIESKEIYECEFKK